MGASIAIEIEEKLLALIDLVHEDIAASHGADAFAGLFLSFQRKVIAIAIKIRKAIIVRIRKGDAFSARGQG